MGHLEIRDVLKTPKSKEGIKGARDAEVSTHKLAPRYDAEKTEELKLESTSQAVGLTGKGANEGQPVARTLTKKLVVPGRD